MTAALKLSVDARPDEETYKTLNSNDQHFTSKLSLVEKPMEKPALQEVLAYAKAQLDYAVGRWAKAYSDEIKDEMKQNGFVRVLELYQRLDPNRGWRSFVQTHCVGAVKDYKKSGMEDTAGELGMERAIVYSANDDSVLDVEETIGHFGFSADSFLQSERFKPEWDLLSRLALHDENIHIVAKALLGYSQTVIAEQVYGNDIMLEKSISRERVSQRIYEFFEKLDSPKLIKDAKTNQYIYALGLSKFYHMPEVDNGYGWENEPLDLNSPTSFETARYYTQKTLFHFANGENLK